jgi:hypothetical protein
MLNLSDLKEVINIYKIDELLSSFGEYYDMIFGNSKLEEEKLEIISNNFRKSLVFFVSVLSDRLIDMDETAFKNGSEGILTTMLKYFSEDEDSAYKTMRTLLSIINDRPTTIKDIEFVKKNIPNLGMVKDLGQVFLSLGVVVTSVKNTKFDSFSEILTC